MHFYKTREWVLLVLMIPIFMVLFSTTKGFLSNSGMHRDVAVTQALAWSRWICAAIVTLIIVVSMIWLEEPVCYGTFTSIINSKWDEIANHQWQGNELVALALHWLSYFRAVEDFAIGQVHCANTEIGVLFLAFLVMSAGNFALIYNVTLGLSYFQIPKYALGKAGFYPQQNFSIFTFSLIITFVLVFILLPLIVHLEEKASDINKQLEEARIYITELPLLVSAEQIYGDPNCSHIDQNNNERSRCFYNPGTKEKIIKFTSTEAFSEIASHSNELSQKLDQKIDQVFMRLEKEAVEEYLDWYYSLWPGEYSRLNAILVNNGINGLENLLMDKVNEVFAKQEYFADFNSTLNEIINLNEKMETYNNEVQTLLDINRLELGTSEVEIISTYSLDNIIQPTFNQDFITTLHRFEVSSVGGTAIGGAAWIVSQKVTAKITGKSILKLTAKVPIKVLTSKVGIGALAGGAAGSVVPIVGTTVGIFAGAAIGIIGGVAIDFIATKIEESYRRENHKQEIISAIQ